MDPRTPPGVTHPGRLSVPRRSRSAPCGALSPRRASRPQRPYWRGSVRRSWRRRRGPRGLATSIVSAAQKSNSWRAAAACSANAEASTSTIGCCARRPRAGFSGSSSLFSRGPFRAVCAAWGRRQGPPVCCWSARAAIVACPAALACACRCSRIAAAPVPVAARCHHSHPHPRDEQHRHDVQTARAAVHGLRARPPADRSPSRGCSSADLGLAPPLPSPEPSTWSIARQ